MVEIKLNCNCDKKFKIIHLISFNKEIGQFKHVKSEIYVENKLYIQKDGCIIRNLNSYRKNVIKCVCYTYWFKMHSFVFYISEINRDFTIKSIDLSWEDVCI